MSKKCPNLVNGSCPLHNLFCAYPECEKDVKIEIVKSYPAKELPVSKKVFIKDGVQRIVQLYSTGYAVWVCKHNKKSWHIPGYVVGNQFFSNGHNEDILRAYKPSRRVFKEDGNVIQYNIDLY